VSDRLDAAVRELVAALRDEIADEAKPAAPMPERLLSIDEAALTIGVGRTALYAEIGAGRLRTCKVGRRRLVPAGAIAELTAGDAQREHGLRP
jgi:excisionase family DNA binding protein